MSLLDEGISAAPDTVNDDSGQTADEGSGASWHWDDNTPGTGERPEWLQPKFKSVAEAAKSFNELEKLKGHAPQDYDYEAGKSWIDPDYEPFIEMADFAKKNHVPQAVMDKFLTSVGSYFDEFKVDMNEEKQKLGANASERLQKLNNWAQSNLSEKSFQALSSGMRTAEAIEALEEIRVKMLGQSSTVPGGNDAITNGGITIEEYRSELNANYAKFKTDPHYRKEMERKLESIVGRN